MVLCLALFDDAALQGIVPRRLSARLPLPPARRLPAAAAIAVGALAALLVFCSLIELDLRFGGNPPAAVRAVDGVLEPLHLVSSYGLFAVMTTRREEIVIEGSNDGRDWREYEFRYKPGDLARRPPWNMPHQPRLDWQMWFAALEDPQRLRWFWLFLERLLHNEPAVTALLATNPFPDRPPLYMRAKFYDYTYSDAAAKAHGIWWQRRLLGLYFPEVQLKADAPRAEPQPE
jgi:lipase maturation factor 1